MTEQAPGLGHNTDPVIHGAEMQGHGFEAAPYANSLELHDEVQTPDNVVSFDLHQAAKVEKFQQESVDHATQAGANISAHRDMRARHIASSGMYYDQKAA